MVRFVFLLALVAIVGIAARPATAQGQAPVYIQIEARPSLAEARERIAAFADRLSDLNGFALGSGWYAIALGPYPREEAEERLRLYLREGLVPRDSFIAFPRSFAQRFWPEDGEPATAANVAETPPSAPVTATDSGDDETPAEAQASEARLPPEALKFIQYALKATGHYDGAIDGIFGRGTRAAMSRWQRARGVPATGILTAAQRAALLEELDAEARGAGLAPVRDEEAGIALALPGRLVTRGDVAYPFVHYEPKNESGVRVVLISRPGDRAALRALFEVLQTLEIVPVEGPRRMRGDSFEIEGANGRIVTRATARLADGVIKGFILVWPAGDERRRELVLGAMEATFTTLPGTLDPVRHAAPVDGEDLVSGLAVRQPKFARSGFFTDERGTVVTAARDLGSCERLTLEREVPADIVTLDTGLGLAVLAPLEPVAPLGRATFADAPPEVGSEIAVAGYSWQGRLDAPTLTWGRVESLQGLNGEPTVRLVRLDALDGDAGGPVLDVAGRVVAMLLPRADRPRQLPDGIQLALGAEAIREALAAAGRGSGAIQARGAALHPIDLETEGRNMTVLVTCW